MDFLLDVYYFWDTKHLGHDLNFFFKVKRHFGNCTLLEVPICTFCLPNFLPNVGKPVVT